jgi:thiazolylpeptide-type bacteriocin precursor
MAKNLLCGQRGRTINLERYFAMSIDTIRTEDVDKTFAAFDIAALEVLEVSQGVALPEMGASGSHSSTSSSSSSTCSAC